MEHVIESTARSTARDDVLRAVPEVNCHVRHGHGHVVTCSNPNLEPNCWCPGGRLGSQQANVLRAGVQNSLWIGLTRSENASVVFDELRQSTPERGFLAHTAKFHNVSHHWLRRVSAQNSLTRAARPTGVRYIVTERASCGWIPDLQKTKTNASHVDCHRCAVKLLRVYLFLAPRISIPLSSQSLHVTCKLIIFEISKTAEKGAPLRFT